MKGAPDLLGAPCDFQMDRLTCLGQRLNLPDQVKVPLGDPARAMGHQTDDKILVTMNVEIGVMIGSLSQVPNCTGEQHYLGKVLENEFLV